MKSTSEHLFTRGKTGKFYIRRRIPTAILSTYPDGKAEATRSLRTSYKAEATKRFRLEQVRIDAEFAAHSVLLKERNEAIKLSHVKSLTDEQICGLAKYWAHRVLLRDAEVGQNGMDEDEFDEHGEVLAQQRSALGKLLARGQVKPILPAMLGFMHLCGLDAELSAESAQKAGYIFLESVVKTLDCWRWRMSACSTSGKDREVRTSWPRGFRLACRLLLIDRRLHRWRSTRRRLPRPARDLVLSVSTAAGCAGRKNTSHSAA